MCFSFCTVIFPLAMLYIWSPIKKMLSLSTFLFSVHYYYLFHFWIMTKNHFGIQRKEDVATIPTVYSARCAGLRPGVSQGASNCCPTLKLYTCCIPCLSHSAPRSEGLDLSNSSVTLRGDSPGRSNAAPTSATLTPALSCLFAYPWSHPATSMETPLPILCLPSA